MNDDLIKRLEGECCNCGYAGLMAEAADALRAQPQARDDAQPVGWLRAVDEEMVCAHLGVADAEDSYETAKKKLASLIQWNIAVATDSSVGGYPAPSSQAGATLCDHGHADPMSLCSDCEAVSIEAPAEAGERDYPVEFEAWWSTYRHRNRDVADYSVKKQIAFDAFYHAATRAQPPARDNRICRICDGGPGNEGVCLCGEEAWEQPQAREDAQPVAYEIVSYETYSGAVWISPDKADEYRTKYGCVLRPLYTRPAPDALLVREALSALVIADDHRPRGLGTTADWIRNSYAPAIALARQALAALQAEQGAK